MNLENGIELMSYKHYRILDDLSLGYFINIFFLKREKKIPIVVWKVDFY
jgi:hypothetical protein